MKKLTEMKWDSFVLDEIFNIKATNSSIDRKKLNGKQGDIPYITRTDKNNGWDSFVGTQEDYNVDKGNVITVGLDTQTAFYQPIAFYTGQNIQIFSNEKVNKYVASFIIPLLKKQMEKFNWGGNGATLGRLRRQKILLPITEEGTPNYSYMEEYMKSVEKRLLERYKTYLTENIKQTLTGGGRIKRVKWEPFFMEDIFVIKSGHDIYQRERINGDTPYITSTSEQNGIGYFVGNTNETLETNCISVNRNGSVGCAFYHPYKALYGNDTRKLIPHNKNKYVCLFLAQVIMSQKEKYGYGLKMGTARLRRQAIMLPIDEKGQPNYNYMKEYIRQKERKLLLKYIDMKLQ